MARRAARAAVLLGLANGVRVNKLDELPDEQLKGCLDIYGDGLDGLRPGLGNHVRKLKNWRTDKVSQRKVFIGAGAGCTGTKSLKMALEMFGMKGWHWDQYNAWTPTLETILKANKTPPVGWNVQPPAASELQKLLCNGGLNKFDYRMPDRISFLIDQPSDVILVRMLRTYPQGKFILTTRPSFEWVKRRRTHVGSFPPIQDPCGMTVEEFQHDADLAYLVELQNQLVRCAVPKERLFEYSIFTDSKLRLTSMMQELAAFTEMSIDSNASFPHELFSEVPLDEIVAGGEAVVFNKLSNHAMDPIVLTNRTYQPADIGPLLQELALKERSLEFKRPTVSD